MAKLPVMTAIEVIRGLKKAGFVFDRQAKGSHEIWYNPVFVVWFYSEQIIVFVRPLTPYEKLLNRTKGLAPRVSFVPQW